jgi:hypothetical protein
MLAQLVEHLTENMTKLAKECNRIADEGKQPPVEYWRGYGYSINYAACEMRWLTKKYADDEATLMAYLEGCLYNWIEYAMDFREEAGVADCANQASDALRYNAQVQGFEIAYCYLTEIVEYVKARGETL